MTRAGRWRTERVKRRARMTPVLPALDGRDGWGTWALSPSAPSALCRAASLPFASLPDTPQLGSRWSESPFALPVCN